MLSRVGRDVCQYFGQQDRRFSMSSSSSGIFRTRFGISSRPRDVPLRDVRSAARIFVVVDGADSSIPAFSLLPLSRVMKAILLFLLIVLTIEDSRVVVR